MIIQTFRLNNNKLCNVGFIKTIDLFLVRIFPLARTKVLAHTNEYIQAYMFNVE